MKRETTHPPLTRDPPGASPGLEMSMEAKQPETMPAPEENLEAGERLVAMLEVTVRTSEILRRRAASSRPPG